MFWCSFFLILLLLLPSLIARAHVNVTSSVIDSFVLRYRYFIFFNLVLVSSMGIAVWFFQPGVLLIIPASAMSIVITVILLILAFGVYALLQDSMVCVSAAVINIVFAVLAILMIVFQLTHHVSHHLGVYAIDIVYALTVAVICFRYSCQLANHYLYAHQDGLVHF